MTMTSSSASSIPSAQLAIQIHQTGGTENIKLNEIPVAAPGNDQILVKVEWSGINFIDTYFRSGLYPVNLPFTLGNEPAGEILALGPNLRDQSIFKIGDKVVTYFRGGGLQQYALFDINRTFKLPQGVSTQVAAGLFLQGLTAITFIDEAYKVKKGDYVLVHSAAGGIGLLLCQLLSNIGAVVIGTTSTKEKADLALLNGANHVVLCGNKSYGDLVEEIKKLTPNNDGTDVIFDGVGKDTWESHFEILKRKGTIVTFGNASGPPPNFSPFKLMTKNLKLCRPMLDNYIYTPAEFQKYCEQLFGCYQKNIIKLHSHKPEGYPFNALGVQEAHRDITSRQTTGKLVVKVA
ncbi:hypothetical protein O181_043925 [Austropuccinia psidii MF-1]|uniref:Enoyl reductase (ER) domain-containing protein n=1 Tax=Austropuccinia psidii MF-1 TaxID=1389203 RepID=A0A9Q3DJ69_9BASI|nr:hypothetical protein [Austropuccinia psidii MF-1]